MSERYPGWVDGMDAREARLATGGLVVPATAGESGDGLRAIQARSGLRPAAGSPGLVRPADAGLAVTVDPFQATIQDGSTAVGGAYLVTLDSPKEIRLTESSQTDDRTDLIVAELAEPDDDNPGGFLVRAVTGSYDTTGPPDLPATAIALAEVEIPTGATAVDPASLTDRRSWTCAVGGVLPIANSSARPENPYPGLYVHNRAIGTLEMYDGDGWRRFLPEDDTGWIDLDLNAEGGWLPRPGYRTPQVRRVGSTAFLRGYAVKGPDVSTDDRRVITVPEGTRPGAHHRWAAVMQGPSGGQERDIVDLILNQGGSVEHWDHAANPSGYWFVTMTSWLAEH